MTLVFSIGPTVSENVASMLFSFNYVFLQIRINILIDLEEAHTTDIGLAPHNVVHTC